MVSAEVEGSPKRTTTKRLIFGQASRVALAFRLGEPLKEKKGHADTQQTQGREALSETRHEKERKKRTLEEKHSLEIWPQFPIGRLRGIFSEGGNCGMPSVNIF